MEAAARRACRLRGGAGDRRGGGGAAGHAGQVAAVGVVLVTSRELVEQLRQAALDARRCRELLEFGRPRRPGQGGTGIGDPTFAAVTSRAGAADRLRKAQAFISQERRRFERAGAFGDPAALSPLQAGLACAWWHSAGLMPWTTVAREVGKPSADAARVAAGAALDMVDALGWPCAK